MRTLSAVVFSSSLAAISLAGLDRACAISDGTAFDPAGDSTSHDVLSASALYDATNIYVSATFRAGSLNPSNLGFFFSFDLDQNPTTGTQPPATFPVGGDRSISFNSLFDPTRARVAGILFPIVFGADSFSLTVPLTALADNGKAYFGLIVGNPASASSFTGSDIAPDSATGQPLSTLTRFIPEPSSSTLAIFALVYLAAGIGRKVLG